MRQSLFVVWLLAIVVTLFGCSDEYPSCPVEGGGVPGDGEQGPEPDHDPAPGPQDPWPGGEGLADDEGYKRLGDGQICRCNMDTDEICSREEPKIVVSDATCNVNEPEDPDCASAGAPDGLCDFGNPGDPDCGEADPEQYPPPTCPNPFWCCYTIECVGKAIRSVSDKELCPEHFGYKSKRYLAFHAWYHLRVKPMQKSMRKEYGTKACYIWEVNCREQPGAPLCGIYPVD
jgi:hypothetical protein